MALGLLTIPFQIDPSRGIPQLESPEFETMLRHKVSTRARSRNLRFEYLEQRHMLAADWQNSFVPRDVNADGVVAPEDAIVAINELNNRAFIDSAGNLPNRSEHPTAPYYDINGDGKLAPLDILSLINALNGDRLGPAITAHLANDTAQNGTVNSDLLTSDGSVSGRVTDNLTGVARLAVQFDQGLMQPVALAPDGTFEFVADLTDGPHTACFNAADGAGHESSTCGAEFTVDTIPSRDPYIVLVIGISIRLIELSADEGTYVTLFVDGEPYATEPSDRDIWRVVINDLAGAPHILTATAQDLAGNTSYSNTVVADFDPPDEDG